MPEEPMVDDQMHLKNTLLALKEGKISIEDTKKKLIKSKELDYNNILMSQNGSAAASGNKVRETSIAIIGMAGQFPKASNVYEYWENLYQGKDCISEIPSSRWDVKKYYDKDINIPGKTNCKWQGILEDVDKFDPLFFNISPIEAEKMDPQHRLFLENCWSCIEDAGINPSELSGSRCGVFAGCGAGDYGELGRGKELNAYGLMGGSPSILSARISYVLNLKGPCLAIDTACSSALVAISEACNSLILNTSDIALAGGVHLMLSPGGFVMGSKAGMLSPSGRCFTFDARANGFVPGEGVGVVLLKRLSDAEKDNDSIYGVIRGWSVNQDGKTNGITAPSVNSQISVEKDVYERFDIDPETITMVEAHGTGTKLGDPIEVEALTEAFQSFTNKRNYCALGSVKSNMGHLVKAAGVAGIIKILLSIKHKMIPPTINFENLNEHISVKDSPFYINTELRPWEVEEGMKRCACVSSFGFSGTNAHIVLEEYVAPGNNTKESSENNIKNEVLFVLSAKRKKQLIDYAQRIKKWVEASECVNVQEVAYTLQTGREAMNYRLAFIMDSKEKLINELNRFIDGEQIIGGICDKIKNKKDRLEKFKEYGEPKAVIKTWLQNKNIEKLAEAWVTGFDIDWKQLYDIKHRRINLPTYPFERERYWISEAGSAAINTETDSMTVGIINPLLHKNTSNFTEQRFSSIFTGEEFFLKDHVVRKQKVLPGVAYLEMAREAVAQSTGVINKVESGIVLKNIVWSRPIVVDENRCKINISLFPQDSDCIDFEIYSQSGEDYEDKTVHSQGTALIQTMKNVPILNLLDLKSRCDKKIFTPDQCYEAFRSVGIEYGGTHKGIEMIHVGEEEVLAKVSLPSLANNTKNQFVLHPALIDSALQASIGLMLNPGENTSIKLGLPFELQYMEVFDKCISTMWAFIRYSDNGKPANKVQKIDIDLCDEKGRVLVRMKGLTSRIVEGEINETTSIGTLMLNSSWKEQSIKQEMEPYNYEQHMVILCEPDEGIAKSIESQMENVSCLTLQAAEKEIDKRFETYANKILEKIKNIINKKPKNMILIQLVISSKNEHKAFAGLLGLLKTAQQENKKIIGQLIEIESNEEVIQKLKDNSKNPFDNHIKYQDDKRYIMGWDEIKSSEEADLHCWKDNGVYLITGGIGGLGLIFSKEIIQKAKNAKLILTGRSLLNKEKESKLKELETSGAQIEYKQVDITQKQDVEYLIKNIQDKYGKLNGIIHAAGVIRDNFIYKKTKEEMKEVLAPKVTGLVNLDYATRDIKLDFFVLFSSGAGVMGNLGQADYSTANAFMDVYAKYRNDLAVSKECQGHTLSINWPLWKDGGMHVDEESQKMTMQSTGMTAMKTSSGIQAFYRSLNSGNSQTMVIEGKVEKIKQKLASIMSPSIEKNTNISNKSSARVTIDRGTLWEKLQGALIKEVSSLLKVKPEDIDNDTELSEYGFDSISLTQFSNKLNEKYKLQLTPTAFFENPTLKSFTEYLTTEYNDIFENIFISRDNESKPNEVLQSKKIIDTGNLLEKIQGSLIKEISKLLKVKVEDIDNDTELSEYGFDSISLTQFANKLNEHYKLELTPTVFFENPTIKSFSEYLINEHKDLFADEFGIKADSESHIKAAEEKQPKKIQRSRYSRVDNHVFEKVEKNTDEPIAIVGVSGIFPEAKDINDFWTNLENGKDCITEIPKDRWDWREYYGNPKTEENKTNIKWGGFIEGVGTFDPLFFGVTPNEAELMEPQQRLMMTYIWNVIEDAGYSAQSISGTNTAIFVGTANTGYSQLLCRANVPIEGYTATGMSLSIGPNRMSYFLNIHGPSEPVETACSSSLIAIHRAVTSIRDGSCDMAIAGGVNTIVFPDGYISFSKAGMLCEDGKCKTFSNKANGYVRGEGVGMLFLKKLKDAEEAGDQIYGVILGTAENHGGRANSLTAPNPKAQAELLKSAYMKSKIDPRTVTYIEAHGTGTELGDPIEINGLKAAFKELYKTSGISGTMNSYCGVGSVKSNIGHLELAAGVAGVIKVLLQMKHKTLAKSLHCDSINPYIKLEDSPFYIVQEKKEWKTLKDDEGKDIPRRAGISSFGFGGANAHVVIEEYVPKKEIDSKVEITYQNPVAIVLSAKNELRIKEQAKQLLETINEETFNNTSLLDMAYTLQVGRESMEERLAILVSSLDQLKEKLKEFIEDKNAIEDLYSGQVKRNKDTMSLFAGDEDLQTAIDTWVTKKKYSKILSLWVKGLNFDWNKLYGDIKPGRISLPTYPFAKERYWVPTKKINSKANVVKKNESDNVDNLNVPNNICQSISSDDKATNTLIEIISDATGYKVENIPLEQTFDEWNFDSIVSIKIAGQIAKIFNFLSSSEESNKLLEILTDKDAAIKDLSEYISKKQKDFLKSDFQDLNKLNLEQKKFLNNIICSDLNICETSPYTVMGKLIVDETHSLFFDHPLDHVSGIHLTEAMSQVAKTGLLSKYNLDSNTELFISEINLEFNSFCDKTIDSLVRATVVEEDENHKLFFKTETIQKDISVATGNFTIEKIPALKKQVCCKEKEDNEVNIVLCDKKIVNKKNETNVMVSEIITGNDSQDLGCYFISQPNNQFCNDFFGEYLDTVVLLEACRQSSRIFRHGFEGSMNKLNQSDIKALIPILKSISIKIHRPILKKEKVFFRAGNFQATKVGDNHVLEGKGFISINDYDIGFYEIKSLLLQEKFFSNLKMQNKNK